MKTRLGILAVSFCLCALFAWGQSFTVPSGGGAGGAATNAIASVKTNGVELSSAATSLDFIQGSNTVLRATNSGGALTVQINAAASAGSGGSATNAVASIQTNGTIASTSTTNVNFVASPTTDIDATNSSGSASVQFHAIAKSTRMTNGQTIWPIGRGYTRRWSAVTSSNLTYVHSGTPNPDFEPILSVTNSAASTNIVIGIPSAYSMQFGSNVTSWPILPGKFATFCYRYTTNELTSGGFWVLDEVQEFEAAFAVTDGLALSSNTPPTLVTLGNTWVSPSNLLFSADNTFTVGSLSGNRPSDIHAANEIFAQRIRPTNSIGGIQIGYLAGYLGDNTNGANIGNSAGRSATNSYNSEFIGYQAGFLSTNSYTSLFSGLTAGRQSFNSYFSSMIGYQAGYLSYNTYGSQFRGLNAGYLSSNLYYAVVDGYSAGRAATNAYYSIFSGPYSGYLATGPHNSIFLGREVGTNGTYQPYTLMIGNSQYATGTNHLIFGDFANRVLRVNGDLEVTEGLRFRIHTNLVAANSNLFLTFNTNRYELRNQSIVILTNIVEEPTASGADLTILVHNTSGGNMYLMWPTYGATNGYYWMTNANNPNATTTIANNKKGIISMTAWGTNITGSLVLTE